MKIYREIITSRNNSLVKWVSSLKEKRGREDTKSFIAEGEKLTIEALKSHLPVTHIFICEEKKDRLFAQIIPLLDSDSFENTEIITLGESAFEKISTEKAPQGVISVIKYLDFFRNMDIIYKEEFFSSQDERALILCSVRDPGNLGSVIRSAVAFGIEHIILTDDSADIYNPKTIRGAMGSLFKIKISLVSDICGSIKMLKSMGRRVFAAELTERAKSINEITLLKSDIFMIGNEGHGIPCEVSFESSGSVYIPISQKTESLNASVAAAVFMWEQNKL